MGAGHGVVRERIDASNAGLTIETTDAHGHGAMANRQYRSSHPWHSPSGPPTWIEAAVAARESAWAGTVAFTSATDIGTSGC
jgi:hypothetical protein